MEEMKNVPMKVECLLYLQHCATPALEPLPYINIYEDAWRKRHREGNCDVIITFCSRVLTRRKKIHALLLFLRSSNGLERCWRPLTGIRKKQWKWFFTSAFLQRKAFRWTGNLFFDSLSAWPTNDCPKITANVKTTTTKPANCPPQSMSI